MAASVQYQISAGEELFEQKLRSYIQHFSLYQNKSNQLQALARVPLTDLKAIAQAKYESSEKQGTTNLSMSEVENVVKDMLLMELMDWFKTEFFSWMNSPPCPRCQQPTAGIGNGVPTSLERSMSAGTVELYTCSSCFSDRREVARFPRYNNPVVLLDTRTGRCGEWANCFALICRASGFEVRHVYDHTDHVWVEVFSTSLKPNRWVHVDPCENSYDNPLLYEVGWGKKLTYIIAISHDDIQDVTPRYSKNFQEIVSRRHEVREEWLVSTILRMRKDMQYNLSENHKAELQKRWIEEIVELLTSKEALAVKSSEKIGRESGSLAWRLARQETGESGKISPSIKGFIWQIGDEYVNNGQFHFHYDCAMDTYGRVNRKGDDVHLKGWENGVFSCEEIFRKEEHDWNMVYLAPRERSRSKRANVCWKFQIEPGFKFASVKIKMKYSIFQPDARLNLKLHCDDETDIGVLETNNGDLVYSWDSECLAGSQSQLSLEKSKSIAVVCELTSGSGNEGWQKVQLFRQSASNRGLLLQAQMNKEMFSIIFDIKRE